MKYFVLIGMLFALAFNTPTLSAQDNIQLHIKQKGVEISSTVSHCTYPRETNTEFDYLLLSITNNNNTPVQISFDKVPYYDGACTNCKEYKNPDLKVLLTLAPGETITPTCKLNHLNNLKVLVAMSQHVKRKLSDIKLENLIIQQL